MDDILEARRALSDLVYLDSPIGIQRVIPYL